MNQQALDQYEATQPIEDAGFDEYVDNVLNQKYEFAQKAAKKAADKKVRKFRRELSRLNALATESLINDNKESYKYAIGKIREFTGKPVTDDVMEMLYKTSRERYVELVQEAKEIVG